MPLKMDEKLSATTRVPEHVNCAATVQFRINPIFRWCSTQRPG